MSPSATSDHDDGYDWFRMFDAVTAKFRARPATTLVYTLLFTG